MCEIKLLLFGMTRWEATNRGLNAKEESAAEQVSKQERLVETCERLCVHVERHVICWQFLISSHWKENSVCLSCTAGGFTESMSSFLRVPQAVKSPTERPVNGPATKTLLPSH